MTLEEIITARLKTFTALVPLTAARVYPQLATQDATFPLHVYERDGTESTPTLSGGGGLKRATVRIDTYGRTEQEVQAPAGEVVNALQGYADRANGLQGCFHTDSSVGTTEDGLRLVSHTFAAWYAPPPAP